MATVLGTLSELSRHVKLKITDSPTIDNIIFKLHYRATLLILLACCILGTCQQFFGKHIKCMTDNGVPGHVIDTFCFFTSTYTVVKHLDHDAVIAGKIPHVGVGPYTREDEIIRHAYYQWVPFALFFQALLFYLPHYLWSKFEGGRLKMLVSGLRMASLNMYQETHDEKGQPMEIMDEESAKRIEQIRYNFMTRLNMNKNWSYALGFCEVLNLVNVVLQIYWTDVFLGGSFLALGPNIMNWHGNGTVHPLDEVFPKVTKCIFHKYGPSGSMQTYDALCVMALNIINEKIYLFLWFWFIIIAIITSLGLIWRLLTVILYSRSKRFNRFVYSLACPGKQSPWDILHTTHEFQFGDWLFLYYIAKNMDNFIVMKVLEQLSEELKVRQSNKIELLRIENEQIMSNMCTLPLKDHRYTQ